MQTLRELKEEYLTLLDMALDEDVDDEALEGSMEAIADEIGLKADSYKVVMDQIQAQADLCAAEVKRLSDRKKTYENRVKRMKNALEKALRDMGKDSIQTDLYKFSIQKNPPSVVIDDEKQVPPEYLIIDYKVNKTAVKDALKAGEAFEWAHMEQTEGLRIR